MLSFLSKGCWRDIAGEGGSPAISVPDEAQLWVWGHSVEPAHKPKYGPEAESSLCTSTLN